MPRLKTVEPSRNLKESSVRATVSVRVEVSRSQRQSWTFFGWDFLTCCLHCFIFFSFSFFLFTDFDFVLLLLLLPLRQSRLKLELLISMKRRFLWTQWIFMFPWWTVHTIRPTSAGFWPLGGNMTQSPMWMSSVSRLDFGLLAKGFAVVSQVVGRVVGIKNHRTGNCHKFFMRFTMCILVLMISIWFHYTTY